MSANLWNCSKNICLSMSIEIEQKTGQKPIPKKTKLNGVYVFGLQLEQINKIRDQQSTSKRRKPFEDLGNSMQLKRSKYFGNQLLNLFEQQALQAFNDDDNVSLEGLIFSVGARRFHINYEELNSKNIELQKQAVVKAMDIGGISRNTYRLLAAIGHDLPREWAVSAMQQQINFQMSKFVPIHIIDLNLSSFQKHSEENNEENIETISNSEIIQEVTSSIGKATYRSIRDILAYIIPVWLKRGVINHTNSVLHIRISGDSRNVGNKVKHVMVTFTLLNDSINLYNPNYHFTLLLYP
ncbi:16037_t:CDS:2, partial [Gigaspora rosea]